MPTKQNKMSRRDKSKKSPGPVANITPDYGKKGQKAVKVKEAGIQLFKGLVKGTKSNIEAAAPMIRAIADFDFGSAAEHLIKGGKTYVANNIQSLKDVIGLIKAFNHPEWYTKYGNVATNLNFYQPNNSTKKGLNVEVSGVYVPYQLAVPGTITTTAVSSSNTMHSVLDSEAWRASIMHLYAKLSGSNASIMPFDYIDLEAYILAVREIVARWANLAQTVTTVNRFEIENAQSPMPALYAMGAPLSAKSVDTIIKSRAYCVDTLNYVARRITAMLPIFPDLSILDRDMWLSGNTFLDDKDEFKATEINFVPVGGQQITYSTGGRMFQTVHYPTIAENTLDECVADLNTRLDAVLSNAPTGVISGYLLKAYGDRAYMVFPELQLNSRPNIVYDEQLLKQFQNAITFDTIGEISQGYEDWNSTPLTYGFAPNTSYSMGTATTGVQFSDDLPILISSENPNVSLGEALSLTAMATSLKMAYASGHGDKKVYFIATSVNTEILGRPSVVYSYLNGMGNAGNKKVIYGIIPVTQIQFNEDFSYLHAVWASQTTMMPTLRMIPTKPSQSSPFMIVAGYGVDNTTWCEYLGDPNIYATVLYNELVAFNRVRTLSMLKTIDIEEQDNWRATTI